jgi:hypothetical protein
MTLLTQGAGSLHYLRDEQMYLYLDNNENFTPAYDGGAGQAIVPEPPKGLQPEVVRPLLRDANPRMAAQAGYLLALMKESDGLEPLVRYWRDHARTDDTWMRLVYRAIAALEDDGKVSILEEIYGLLRREEQANLRDFYWTIRPMEGPNALRLRKQMRNDVGMENLR